jgi:hypothetical protein
MFVDGSGFLDYFNVVLRFGLAVVSRRSEQE